MERQMASSLPRYATHIPIRALDSTVCGALVPASDTMLRFAQLGVLPGVLPSCGGSEWTIRGDMIRVYAKSFTRPEQEINEAVSYLWSFRREFGRRRNPPTSGEVSEHRHKFRELMQVMEGGPAFRSGSIAA